MSVYVYILHSHSLRRYYVGITHDPRRRLKQHVRGNSRWTSRTGDWSIIHWDACADMIQACKREKTIKARGAARFLQMLPLPHPAAEAGQG